MLPIKAVSWALSCPSNLRTRDGVVSASLHTERASTRCPFFCAYFYPLSHRARAYGCTHAPSDQSAGLVKLNTQRAYASELYGTISCTSGYAVDMLSKTLERRLNGRLISMVPRASGPVSINTAKRRLGRDGGTDRIRTGVHGFAIRCVASPPRYRLLLRAIFVRAIERPGSPRVVPKPLTSVKGRYPAASAQ